MIVALRLMCGLNHFDDNEEQQQRDNLVYDPYNLQMFFPENLTSQLTFSMKVIMMATGRAHMAVVTEEGALYTRGDGILGQLGLGEDNKVSYYFKRIDPKHFRFDKLIMVTCGSNFCTTMTTEGQVFAWGENRIGCLGLGVPLNHRQYEPKRVNFENVATSKLCMISSSNHHTLALGIEGEVYAWGANAKGQLGLGTESMRLGSESFPKKLWDQETNDQKFVVISAGGKHSSAVTKDGRVYTWGANCCGQLGLGVVAWLKVFPTLVTGLIKEQDVVMTSCGDKHTLLLTRNGGLWSTGRGSEGQQLSIGIDNQHVYAFDRITENGFNQQRVITAIGGDGNSIAVRQDGAVITWGAGYSSNLSRDIFMHLMGNAIGKKQPAATCYATISRREILAFAMGTHERLALKDPEHNSPIHHLAGKTELLRMIWDAGRNEPLPSHITPNHEGLVWLIGGGCFD